MKRPATATKHAVQSPLLDVPAAALPTNKPKRTRTRTDGVAAKRRSRVRRSSRRKETEMNPKLTSDRIRRGLSFMSVSPPPVR